MSYRYILFDLDGTLTNSKEGIGRSVQYALDKMGREVPPMEELDCYIGPPLDYSFREFAGMEGEDIVKAIAYYRERYSTVGLYENDTYDGIPQLLERLKKAGKVIALASSKPEFFAIDILKHFHIYEYFDYIFGAIPGGERNSKEEVIQYALEIMDISTQEKKRECVMIGDRHYDILGARFFDLDSIGVNYGFAPEGELKEAGATYVCETVAELEALLLNPLSENE